ncbi:MAG: HAD family hydrolase [Bacteroidales bacterium]|nr:HAD family hydrolase [Bacteroidales bacterium]
MRTKAIFLDRDGVINDGSLYYTYRISDFKFNDGLFEGLRMLRDAGFIFVVITNQAGVAKGLYSERDVEALHQYMCDELRKQGIEIAGVYYCPHYPEISGPCECRKPGTLLIERAIKEFNIDRTQSFLIGDGSRDIEAAERAGITGIKINKNESIVPYCKELLKMQ